MKDPLCDPNTGAAPASLKFSDADNSGDPLNVEMAAPEMIKGSADPDLFTVEINGNHYYINKKEALTVICQLTAQMLGRENG